jgi:hypothetical protein
VLFLREAQGGIMDKLIKFFKAIVYFATLPFSIWFWEKPKAKQDVSSIKNDDNNSIHRTH